MLSHDINPVIFWLGRFPLTYYWLVYFIGFILALFLLLRASKNKDIKMSTGQVYSIIFLSIIGMTIFARIFHIVFWDLNYYLTDPVKILYIWQGGVSFHGGLFGALFVTGIYCKIYKINFWRIADLFALLGILMPVFSRLANFINQEIIGTITNFPWCFKFKHHSGCRHPVQLYAAAGRLLFFGIIIYWRNKAKEIKEGFIFWLFIFGIGFGRFVLDFLREDVVYFGLKAGQWLSIPMVFIGGIVLYKFYIKDFKKLLNYF